MSDGSGDTPTTVWSATPIFANDTLYVGTPFYRTFALEPDTGKVKWVYDSEAKKVTPTQPALKNRGVAYWQSSAPGEGPCQKRVYIGTMEGLRALVLRLSLRPCRERRGGCHDIGAEARAAGFVRGESGTQCSSRPKLSAHSASSR